MGNKKYLEFIRQSEPLTNKDESINNFVSYALNKLQSMFHYEGLPDTIPQKWLEYFLMVNGNCFIAKDGGKLYAFIGGLGGEYDEYYQPTTYVVSNPYLKLSKEYGIGVDGILVRNDTLMQGMLPIIRKYGSLLTEADLTMRTALINLRIFRTISASDDITKESADSYMNKIINGELSVIGENPFFNGVKVEGNESINGYMQGVIEATQYIKASFYNEIGLNANYNLKREYISTTENTLADDILLPLIDDMLTERKEAVEKINAMFGTDISVDLYSVWKTNQSEDRKENAETQDAIENVSHETMESASESESVTESASESTSESESVTESASESTSESESVTESTSESESESVTESESASES